jgi:uncharacterized protein (DUF302 family)
MIHNPIAGNLAVLLALLFLTPFPTAAGTVDGLEPIRSRFSVEETERRLVSLLEAKGMTIVARVDHAAGALKAGLELEPTRLVIFGNPRLGTLLMQCRRSVAIDLPMKALVWREGDGVWLAYNTAGYLDDRHDLAGCEAPLARARDALAGFARQATGH